MSNLDKCSWKMVDPKKFIMGQSAERCGEVAQVKILRPNRKNDLFLCEHHVNAFIKHWGLHNEVEILCLNWLEGSKTERDFSGFGGKVNEELVRKIVRARKEGSS